MPPAVIGAGIAGVTQLGGALIGSRAQGNAAKAQERATMRAMALERERDAEARRRYDASQADYQRRLAAYEANRRAVLEKYGARFVDAPGAAPGPAAATPGAAPGMVSGGPAGVPGRLTLADITQRPGGREQAPPPPPIPDAPVRADSMGAPPPMAGPPGGSLAELSDPTFSWRKFHAAG